jgi:hypothetical protein
MKKDLGYGFYIEGKDTATYREYGVFTRLAITRNNKTILEYDNRDEFKLDILEVYLFSFEDGKYFELLFERVSPPSKSLMTMVRIINDSVIYSREIPSLDIKPKNIDEDANNEFGGYWRWTDCFGEDYSLTTYNPIIIYEISRKGISIDSLLTVKINTYIYGEFLGYEYNSEIAKDISCSIRFDEIINKYQNQY